MEALVGDVRLAFEVYGQAGGQNMVLLHALGERGSSWRPIAERFAGSYQVFTIDLRGHGDSDWPGAYSFQAMCADVTALLDQLGLQSTVLIGHSMGGVIAYLVAMQRADLVERLIVEDVSPPYRRDQLIPTRPTGTGSLGFDWAVVPAILTEVNAGAPEMWASLERIAAPTLLIGGGPESHIPQDKLSEVADRIPACELVTIPVGHHVHALEPGQYADAIEGWVRNR